MNLAALAGAALLLVAAAGATAGWLGGRAAALPALVMGAAAALTQLAAARIARRVMDDPRFTRFLAAWALGVGLRFGGVLLLAVVTLAAPLHFPPLPSAFAFLAVLIPLLLLEIRLTR